jgi:dTMP kinase
MNTRGRFITFEGTEGSGKTLQLAFLEARLRKQDVPYLLTREPGGTAYGDSIRRILLRQDNVQREPMSELLLYLADRYQHLHEIVEPALAKGTHVISDRYHDATLAYQAYARGIGLSRVDKLAEILGLRKPDLTIILDIEVETGLQRARIRNKEESKEEWGRFEAEELAFHRKVREGYHLLAEREPQRMRLIDASGSPDEVAQRVVLPLTEIGLFSSVERIE